MNVARERRSPGRSTFVLQGGIDVDHAAASRGGATFVGQRRKRANAPLHF
jgi:hypothetical protein